VNRLDKPTGFKTCSLTKYHKKRVSPCLEIRKSSIYFVVQSAFYMDQNQQSLEALQEIKRMMERSTRFLSLSGLSGIAAGTCGLGAAAIAYTWINDYYKGYDDRGAWALRDFARLEWRLFILGIITMAIAFGAGFYFTWRKARRTEGEIWNSSSRRLLVNLCIPLLVGGVFIVAMLKHSTWMFIGPACLVFYGLALINGSKYTLDEIRYLGMLEIILGCVNLFWPGYSLYFWATGFGVLHIVYGLVMWNKYERGAAQ
jgi:uncharacterized membrane protein HdeD (DUF308 family)